VILDLLYLVESFESPQNHLTWIHLEIRFERLSRDGEKVENRLSLPSLVHTPLSDDFSNREEIVVLLRSFGINTR
jgi:hypothetical protein